MKILFVCLGNICRSPAAEGIFTDLIRRNGLQDSIQCDSAGIQGYHSGEGAYPKMKAAARRRDIELTSISRQVNPAIDFQKFDLLVGMDNQNIADLRRKAPSAQALQKIVKMTDFCTRHKQTEVPDPWYGDTKDYELVLDLLEDACEGLIQHIGRGNKGK